MGGLAGRWVTKLKMWVAKVGICVAKLGMGG
jgi:hypothetical protein